MIHAPQPPAAPRPRSNGRRTLASRRVSPETPFIGGPGRTQVDAWDPSRSAPAGYEACVQTLQDFRRVLLDASQERAGVTEVLFAAETLEWALDASRSWGPDRLEGIRRRLEVARVELSAYVAREADALPTLVRLRLLSRAHFFRECALHVQAEVERAIFPNYGQLPR
jgi:hypothetical protein